MSPVGRTLFAIALLSFSAAFANPLLPQNVAVVRPKCEEWMAQRAAEEFAKYVQAMGIVPVTLTDRAPKSPAGVVVTFEVGEVKALESLPGADDPDRLVDGFTVTGEGKNGLHFASPTARGLMYAVYHYLETCCDVGFFWEGDHVSKLPELPVEGVNIREIPRWPMRSSGRAGSWGLAKFHGLFNTIEFNERIADWMAKSRLNWTMRGLGGLVDPAKPGDKKEDNSAPPKPDKTTLGGWVGAYVYPSDVMTDLALHSQALARQRGIQHITATWLYNTSKEFREAHPEYKFIDGKNDYGSTTLDPRDPRSLELAGPSLKSHLSVYGHNDHVWFGGIPFVEARMSDDPEEDFQIKLDGMRKLFDAHQKFDPKLKYYVWDTWELSFSPTVWTPERVKAVVTALPKEKTLIYDLVDFLGAAKPPFYKRTDYFYGYPWALALLESFQGENHPHGELPDLLDRFQELSKDPAAQNCRGVFHVPETMGHNRLYFDFASHLAWNPEGVTLANYLDKYAARRYGRDDAKKMRGALDSWVKAVHSDFMPYYHIPNYLRVGEVHAPQEWLLFPGAHGQPLPPHSPLEKTRLATMENALRAALACRSTQQDNPLYMEDMTEWSKAYVSLVFNWATLDAYRAYQAGDPARARRSGDMARVCMRQIENILSTRPDYYLQPQIDAALAVPGANPAMAWCMKQHMINWLYSSNDCYEQMHWFYAPRTEVYLSELERRAKEGIKTFTAEDIAPQLDAIKTRWLEEDIAIPAEQRYSGTTIEAVREAVDAVAAFRPYIDQFVLSEMRPFEAPEGAIVIDPNGKNIERTGGWYYGAIPHSFCVAQFFKPKGNGSETFRWKFTGIKPGRYEVSVWVCDDPNKDHATDQAYTVYAKDGIHRPAPVDFTKDLRAWRSLGVYDIDETGSVVLTDATSANTTADAVMLLARP